MKKNRVMQILTGMAFLAWSGVASATVVGGSLVNLQAGSNAGDVAAGVWSNNGSLGGEFNPDASYDAPPLFTGGDGIPYYAHKSSDGAGGSWGDEAGTTVDIPLGGSWTIENWIRATEHPTGGENQLFMLRGGQGGFRAGVFLRHNNEDALGTGASAEHKHVQLELRNTDDSAGNRVFIGPNINSGLNGGASAPVVPLDQWFHLAVTWDNDAKTVEIWGDGQKETSVSGLNGLDYTTAVMDENTVGIQNYLEGGGRAFRGHYNTFRVYGSALSDAEIQQNFGAGAYVPEPGTLSLLGLGAFLVCAYRRRVS